MTSLPIKLPDGFHAVVAQDDEVKSGQTIASKNDNDLVAINIPQFLSISPKKAKNALRKIPGEQILKDDIIALKQNWLGTKKVILRSSVEGTILKYERDSGNLIIKSDEDDSEDVIVSPIDGRIGLCNNEKILINTDKNFIVGNKGVGDEAVGEIFVLEASDVFRLNSNAIGKIVVGERLGREILLKGIGIGVAGMIGSEILDEDIEHIKEKNFQMPIVEINEENLKEVSGLLGKKTFVDAKTNTIIFLAL